jgi:ferredoxin
VQNLAAFLPEYKGRKIGVVVKGCDSKAVVELVQENLIKREEVVVFGMGCNGTVNTRRIRDMVGEDATLTDVQGQGAELRITLADGKTHALPMLEIAQDKCRVCSLPSAECGDRFAGKPTVIPEGAQAEAEAVMTLLEGMTLDQRLGFWKGHMERCIRCYACRNACPMCVCRDHCVADSRDPHWMTQDDTSAQKLFFQLIHAMHLAGRCVACGECGRSCPVGIPLYALKIQINRIVNRLFDYEAGRDAAALPPLLGFEVQERNIQEHHIKGA